MDGWKTKKGWSGKPVLTKADNPSQWQEDRDLCEEAVAAFPDSEFAHSCAQQVEAGRLLTDKQREGLRNTINAAWDGGLDDE